MSEESDDFVPRWRTRRILLGAVLFVAALGGAVLFRSVRPERGARLEAGREATAPRPIVQFVRQQAGLPDLSDVVARLCPSVAVIVPRGQAAPAGSNGAPPAFAYSADGWIVTSASNVPAGDLDAVFGDGRRTPIGEVRPDPVSGLAVAQTGASATPLPFGDQPFPRVGQMGLAIDTPVGAGCSAFPAMVASDFIADGGNGVGYARLSPVPDRWSAGVPLVGSDGTVIAIGVDGIPGGLLPLPVAAVIFDELIRGSASAPVAYGFRAVDFTGPIADRLGDVRSGASVALVQAKSSAARAGLQAGDIVTAVDDNPVSSASELSRTLDGASGKVTLTVQRGSEVLHFTLRPAG